MPKFKLNSDAFEDLAANPTTESGRFNRDLAVRNCLTESIRQCSKSREQLADELSELTGRLVSVAHLNDWCAPSKHQFRFPASHILAFCKATGDNSLSRLLLTPRDAAMIRLAEAFLKKESAETNIDALKQILRSGGSE
jgi:hypothetical protein